MKIRKIGIIGGTNGIGKSFAEFMENTFSKEVEVYTSGRRTKVSNIDIVKNCDLVIFSVPIEQTVEVIKSLIPFSRTDQIWMDFTSIKEVPVKAMLRSKAEVCGAHPLFGPLKNIRSQKMVLTPARISMSSLNLLKLFFHDFELLETTPEKHDKIMGVIQNLSHFSDFVLGKTLKDAKVNFQEVLEYSSPPYRIKLDLLARIFAQNPSLYASISTQNTHGRKLEALFLASAQFFLDRIKTGDSSGLSKEFKAIKSFLGTSFCENSWVRSQKILDFEKTLLGKETKSVQERRNPSVWAIFGNQYSHTDEASLDFRKKDESVNYFRNIFEVFDAVESGKSDYGIVPYENTTKGSIFETLDELFERKSVKIIEACQKVISQNLLVVPGTEVKDIRFILSHPQALAQSQRFLRKKLPRAQFKNRRSTALAAQEVAMDGVAEKSAIGSTLLAKKLGLSVLFTDMQEAENKTRFVVITKRKSKNKEKHKHVSFVFWFTGDESGNLVKVLTSLSDRNINLTKLDSRRAGKEYGGYLFFVDAQISPTEFEKIKPRLRSFCGGIKVLGSF